MTHASVGWSRRMVYKMKVEGKHEQMGRDKKEKEIFNQRSSSTTCENGDFGRKRVYLDFVMLLSPRKAVLVRGSSGHSESSGPDETTTAIA